MTVALLVQSDVTRWLVAFSFPPYRPSSLLFVIFSLLMALTGLGVDIMLHLPVGTIGMIATAGGLGLVLTVLFLEILERDRWRNSRP